MIPSQVALYRFQESAGIDIDDGRIVEHWDTLRRVLETSANDTGMF